MADRTAAVAHSVEMLKERKPFYYFIDGEFIVNMDAPAYDPVQKSPPVPSWSAYYCGDGEFIVNLDPPPSALAKAVQNEMQNPIDPRLVLECQVHKEVPSTETMTFSEIAGDICKWMMYDNLVVNSGWSSGIINWTDDDKNSLHVLFGSIAAVAGKYVQDLTPTKDSRQKQNRVSDSPIRYGRTALEGGVLFGTYKSTLSFLNSVVPDDWNKQFLFQSVLESVEKTLPGL